MAQHYFPDRRMPYERDGTRIFYRTGRLQTISGVGDRYTRDLSYNELQSRAREYLNCQYRYSIQTELLTNPIDPASSTSDRVAVWDMIFFFPEPMDISGIYVAGKNQDFVVSTSRDTTAIDDGTWYDHGTIQSSVRSWFSDGYEEVVPEYPWTDPDPENFRFRVFRVLQDDEVYIDSPEWHITPGFPGVTYYLEAGRWDTAGTYRWNTFDQAPDPGIYPLYGKESQGIVALRITPKILTVSSANRAIPSFGQPVNIHLYGRPSHLGDWGVEVVNDDGSVLGTNDLVWGNVARARAFEWAETHYLPPFRVRNYSSSRTANDVTIWMTQALDQDHSFWLQYDSPMEWFSWRRSPSDSWVSKPYYSDDVLNFNLGSLAPGEISGPIYVRFNPPAFGSYQQDGPGQVVFETRVGSWT